MKRFIYFPAILLFMHVAGGSASGQDNNAITKATCRLYADVGNTSSVIKYLKKGTPLAVEEKYDDYYFVKVDSTGGFVQATKISLNAEAEFVDYNRIAEEQSMENNSGQATEDRLTMLVNKYGDAKGRALYALKIWKGIDHNMVKDSWGKPARVNRKIEYDIVTEEWIYPKATLFFRDGTLVGWKQEF